MAVINGTPASDNLVGTAGNDTIKGAAGNDTIDGGLGNDLVVGGLGNDSIQLGDGDDVFQWGQKDWSEHVEGGSGIDRGEITGVTGGEGISVNLTAGQLYVADFIGFGGPIVTLNDVEQLLIRPLGGADSVFIADTTGTDLQQVTIDLAATANGASADAQTDTVTLMGGLGDNTIAAAMVSGTITVTGLPVAMTIRHVGKTDVIALDGGSGNDTIDVSFVAAGKAVMQVQGGVGEDFIYGSEGNDLVDGGSGNDILLLYGGNDRASWQVLGGNDTIEGYAGTDTVVVDAAGGSLDIFGLAGRARIGTNAGTLLDTGGIERFEVRGDADGNEITVEDLTGTAVTQVAIDLAPAGTTGNGFTDFVSVFGSAGNNTITTKLTAGTISINGLPTQLSIAHADGDRLGIDGGDGDDSINVSTVPIKIIDQFVLAGGNGNDTLTGSAGTSDIIGGSGNDVVAGRGGNDFADLGSGNDLLLWTHGDGSDFIIGGADFDTLRLTGAAVDEQILLGSIGGQTKLIHGPDAATLTLQTMERIQLATLGGADLVFVQNLATTGIAEVAIDLAATVGGKTADTKSDAVAFSGTTGGDNIFLQMVGSKITVNGLAVAASVDHVGKTDIITLIGGDGHDTISAGAIAAGKAVVQIIGGDDNDSILGSKGNDSVVGGTGNDFIILGDGNDVFVCVTGDGTDEVNGDAGTDTFKFGAVSGLGPITVAPDIGGIDLIRPIEGAVANMNDIERIELGGAAGFDDVVVQNLAGTDVKLVAIDFGTAGGNKGDSVHDSASVSGGDGNETITIALSAGVISVKGLASQVTIAHADALDSLGVACNGGNDTVNAATVPLIELYLDGGAGNDKLTGNSAYNAIGGGEGNDTLSGGGGNDSVVGGGGNDRIDGGAGNDGVLGEAGNDYLVGGTGNDGLIGGTGNDTITGGTGSDTIYYTDVMDGHDTVIGFDGNAAGGQDVLSLQTLFNSLSVSVVDRAGRVSIVDHGASVEIAVDTNGDLSFDLAVATLKTADVITVGQDIFVGI